MLKNRQYNGQKKKDNNTNNDPQHTTQKTKRRVMVFNATFNNISVI